MGLATKYKTIFYHPRDADANKYFGYITTPLSTRKKWLISELAKQLKSDGNWVLHDRLWLFGNETAQAGYVSLINPSSTQITDVNSTIFTANQGIEGNGTTSYLNTNFNASTQGVNMIQDSNSLFFYSRTNIQSDGADLGNYGATGALTQMLGRTTTDIFRIRINSDSAIFDISNTNSSGLLSIRRTSSTNIEGFRNGVSLGTSSQSSLALVNNNIYICCQNANGTPSSFTTRQYAVCGMGSGSINHLLLYNAIQAYMTALGTQV